MQEHIRRAHPEHYIAKLPATEESFLLMINTPPQERKPEQSPASAAQSMYFLAGWLRFTAPPSSPDLAPAPH